MRGFFLNAQPMIRNHGSHGKPCDQSDVFEERIHGGEPGETVEEDEGAIGPITGINGTVELMRSRNSATAMSARSGASPAAVSR
jgi:hypothetical protein